MNNDNTVLNTKFALYGLPESDNFEKNVLFSKLSSQKHEGLSPLSPVIAASALLHEFNSTTEYLDALLTARNDAFLQQSKDDFKSLKKFNQLLMK
ncbi:hypothetical protein HZA96_03375 [Candidatus Woesearchaeota archaeon]|nr:hypothetical protein [Candidatus Woesearchaeota archaeon]